MKSNGIVKKIRTKERMRTISNFLWYDVSSLRCHSLRFCAMRNVIHNLLHTLIEQFSHQRCAIRSTTAGIFFTVGWDARHTFYRNNTPSITSWIFFYCFCSNEMTIKAFDAFARNVLRWWSTHVMYNRNHVCRARLLSSTLVESQIVYRLRHVIRPKCLSRGRRRHTRRSSEVDLTLWRNKSRIRIIDWWPTNLFLFKRVKLRSQSILFKMYYRHQDSQLSPPPRT